MAKMSNGDKFLLDDRLAADTLPVGRLRLCAVRLMNDARFPWLVLIPERPDKQEVFDLAVADQALLFREISETAELLKQLTACDKINIAAFGNMVAQLHIHVVARSRTDPAWPGSAIGFAGALPYDDPALTRRMAQLAPVFGG